jgi:hypothetical protein
MQLPTMNCGVEVCQENLQDNRPSSGTFHPNFKTIFTDCILASHWKTS